MGVVVHHTGAVALGELPRVEGTGGEWRGAGVGCGEEWRGAMREARG